MEASIDVQMQSQLSCSFLFLQCCKQLQKTMALVAAFALVINLSTSDKLIINDYFYYVKQGPVCNLLYLIHNMFSHT